MTEAWTLGGGSRRRRFRYLGSVATGVEVLFTKSSMRVSSGLFAGIVNAFAGRTIPGGFSQSNPTPGGLGEWVARYSRLLNETTLTPRHASYVAAVLVGEGYASGARQGNAIYLTFPRDADDGMATVLPEVLPPPAAWQEEEGGKEKLAER
jgi:hypothetical protein